MIKLVLVRHGQSIWNLENRFTGWTDVGLSEQGIKEAKEAGQVLKDLGYTFDIAYTSYLKRANDTLTYILEELGEKNIPIKYSWRLNERHYGALQGLNKDDTRKKYGEEQVRLWRRSADVRPPALEITDERYPGNDSKYKDLAKEDIPTTENLIDTIERVIKYWNSDIKTDKSTSTKKETQQEKSSSSKNEESTSSDNTTNSDESDSSQNTTDDSSSNENTNSDSTTETE